MVLNIRHEKRRVHPLLIDSLLVNNLTKLFDKSSIEFDMAQKSLMSLMHFGSGSLAITSTFTLSTSIPDLEFHALGQFLILS